MGLKGISGVLVPIRGEAYGGNVTIKLADGSLESPADADFVEVAKFGSGVYRSEPCKIVSLRFLTGSG